VSAVAPSSSQSTTSRKSSTAIMAGPPVGRAPFHHSQPTAAPAAARPASVSQPMIRVSAEVS